jgi:hypothetical protein
MIDPKSICNYFEFLPCQPGYPFVYTEVTWQIVATAGFMASIRWQLRRIALRRMSRVFLFFMVFSAAERLGEKHEMFLMKGNDCIRVFGDTLRERNMVGGAKNNVESLLVRWAKFICR